MRIFIAIPISENLQKEIVKYREFYPDLSVRPVRNGRISNGVRWLEGKNLHITLIPPWKLEENSLELIKKVLKPLEGKIGPITADFNRVSYGPNRNSPRLIWAIGKAPKAIIGLKKALEESLDKPSERNEFLLHLTLARFKPEDFQFFPIKKIDDEINWKETFNEFAIMQSHLSPNGADYEILERFKL